MPARSAAPCCCSTASVRTRAISARDAFRRLTGDNKELYIVPDANHTDLYDNMERIPFDRIESFFKENLR